MAQWQMGQSAAGWGPPEILVGKDGPEFVRAVDANFRHLAQHLKPFEMVYVYAGGLSSSVSPGYWLPRDGRLASVEYSLGGNYATLGNSGTIFKVKVGATYVDTVTIAGGVSDTVTVRVVDVPVAALTTVKMEITQAGYETGFPTHTTSDLTVIARFW